MKVQFPSQLLVPKILKGFKSPKKIILFYGWRDGGKSTSVAKVLIAKLLLDEHFRGVHVRKHYNEISTSTFENLSNRVAELKMQDFISITKDHFRFTNKERPSNFLFGAGSDNPDKIRSTQDLNLVWYEEFHDANQRDFESIYGTIREKKGFQTKFIATLNNDKVPENSFIDKMFFQKSSPIYDQVERIHINWRNNPFIDHKLTEDKLRLICFGDNERFDTLDKGYFIPEGKGTYYPEFSNDLIYENIELDPNYPLLISFDFNYEPCSLVVCQHQLKRGGGFHIIKELQRDGGTRPLVNDLKSYLRSINWTGGIRITGDASGHKHDTRSGSVTDFEIIREEMSLPKSFLNYNNKSNMSLGLSRDMINTGFFHKIVKISKEGCPMLLRDIRLAKPVGDTSELQKDRDVYKMDLLDAFRYGFHHEYKNIHDIEKFKLIY